MIANRVGIVPSNRTIIGVAILLSTAPEVPWIAFAVATSFALYGLFRKTIPAVDGVIGLTAETMLLSPFALAFLTGSD